MSRQELINVSVHTLQRLPETQVNEAADFIAFLSKRYEEDILQKGIHSLVNTSETFAFLHNEEDLYTEEDLKERYR